LVVKRVLSFAALAIACTSALARGPDCGKDLDACVAYAVAENAAFIDECGKAFPKAKDAMERAFRAWPVLLLPIPGVPEIASPDHELRLSLAEKIGPYLRAITTAERQSECTTRFQMMLARPPTLKADSVVLPDGVLRQYEK